MSDLSREAFTAIMEPHFKRLYRLAYRLAGCKADAEDLLQDVLTKLYQRRAELSSIRELSPWLSRVVYNQFVDGTRRYGRQPLRLVGDVETGSDSQPAAPHAEEPQQLAERGEQLQAVAGALTRLSEEQRIVLLMHDTEGYTLTEIQDLTGTPVGTLKSRLHRARARLRELLSTANAVATPSSTAHGSSMQKKVNADGTFSDATSCKPLDGVGKDAL